MSDFIFQVVIALLLAKVLGEVLRKGDIHPIVGDILIGILLGPTLLGFLRPEGGIEYLASFGLIVLMFYTGLTSDIRTLAKRKGLIVLTGISGVAVTFILIFLTCLGLGLGLWASVFIALALSNTATEVSAIIMEKARGVDTEIKQIVIGASFIDDVLAVYLITLLRVFTKGTIAPEVLIMTSLKIVVFILAVIYISKLVVTKATNLIYKLLSSPPRMITTSIIIAFSLALAARLAGLNEVIGAYLGGLAISRLREIHDPMLVNILRIESLSMNLKVMLESFLTPLFFLYVGVLYNATLSSEHITMLVALISLAAIGKVVGCGLPILVVRKNLSDSLFVGAGMVGRGALESAIIVFALKANLITPEYYDIILTTTLTLTILAPLILKLVMKLTRKI
ncbi:MAG TPA: cation:proton antiporter [Acidilobales archaeon]|nr:MAG: sodium:proton exchanger [Desulfurococcales archaeon ex4484_42]HDD26302.1 cation:proton antiporter [Acidilobales archaeon]